MGKELKIWIVEGIENKSDIITFLLGYLFAVVYVFLVDVFWGFIFSLSFPVFLILTRLRFKVKKRR